MAHKHSITTMTENGPLFAQVERELRRRIASGELNPGDRVPSLAQLCATFSVSAITVRRALRELTTSGLLRGEQGRGVFVTEASAPTGPAVRSQVAIIVPDVGTSAFYAPIMRGLREVLGDGTDLLFSESLLDPARELTLIQSYVERRLAGLVVVPITGQSGMDPGRLTAVLAGGPPVVLVDRDMPGLPADRVTSDNVAAGRLATQHLLALGHRRVACVWAHACSTYDDRRRGWEEAHRSSGMAVDPALDLGGWEPMRDHEAAGYVHALELLHLPDPPTAFFACGDHLAMGVLRACRKVGRRIPGDISIVGNDDLPLAASLDPALTTIRQDLVTMGRIAATLLRDRIADPKRPIRSERVGVQLVVRASTGVPPR